MPGKPKALVVGTTTDYIDWIRNRCPGRSVFLTDPILRRQARESAPSPAEEILCELTNYDLAVKTVKQHFRREHFSLAGIACFDCESMELAAALADEMSLLYPSVEAVRLCRDKNLSKIFWRKNGINGPKFRVIHSNAEAADFFREINGPCVLKPLNGSGSELVFLAASEQEGARSYLEIVHGLSARRSNRLFGTPAEDVSPALAEEFIAGDEYSADFIIENDQVRVIRVARKIKAGGAPFGTIRAYVLPASLPGSIDPAYFSQALGNAARALGIERAICMLDFFIRDKEIIPIELAPRPGGDCLPFLILKRLNLDMLKLTLDFAERRPLVLPPADDGHPPYIGLRLHAERGGTLKLIDAGRLSRDSRVKEIHLTREPGHVIEMPPADYDSWLLGHIIFAPDGPDLEAECDEISGQVRVEVE